MLKKIPGSGFFRGIIVGIIIMMSVLYYGMPGYILIDNSLTKIIPGTTQDTMTFEDTQQAMEELYNVIQREYYDADHIDATKMARQALVSLVSGLGDPFSSYYPPEESKDFMKDIQGNSSIEGIGAILSQTQAGVIIEEVINNSPAAQAGLRPLDVIVKVDDTDIQQQSIYDVVDMIRGKRGTEVSITVLRKGLDDEIGTFETTIIRDTIEIPSVSSSLMTGDNGTRLGYIALSLFAADTDRLLVQAINDLLTQNIQGVILDLRGNGGGLLPESVSVVSHFLTKGSPVVSVNYRVYRNTTYKAEGGDTLSPLPLVILTNGYTASASEIITLALREDRCANSIPLSNAEVGSGSHLSQDCTAVVVGDRTFGKGTVQSLQNLSFGGSLKLTVGHWYSPSGLSINGIGILPDYLVSFDNDAYYESGYDNQLELAKTLLEAYL